ncbi:MAG: NAD+ synthase, partial [Nevskiales bacterium]
GFPEFAADGMFNAAAVFHAGERVVRYRKQCLPNYGVFDEKRHFRRGRAPGLFDLKGLLCGITICEDIWEAEPAARAAEAGAKLLININASPFEVGKSGDRAAVLQQRAAATGLNILYVNCVGGQDELIFDGDSQVCRADGQTAYRAPSFAEGLHLVELAKDGSVVTDQPPGRYPSDEGLVWRGLCQAIRDYVDRNGFKGVLLGLSGGIDSAVTLALAVDALGADRVWGVSMPSRYTADMSRDDAGEQARRMGARFDEIAIEPIFSSFLDGLAPFFADTEADLTEENLQSRSRGALLMALSNKFNHLVLATGNKSEMAVGYATLYGDMCGGFAPLKDVYKTFVYRLAEWRNEQPGGEVIPRRVIDRPPSAELRPDQQDSDSLPDYAVLDPIIRGYVEDGLSIDQLCEQGFSEEDVRRVAGLIRRSEYKRRQAPPGPKVTARAFGRERRYPITAVYGDI